MPAATQTLLDDAAVNIDQWIAEEVRARLRRAGGHRLRDRRRHQQAEGLPRLRRRSPTRRGRTATSASSRRGVAGALPGHRSRRDKLVDLVYAVKAGYRANGTFVMNRATQSVVRKMKDADGNYLWQPAAQAGRGLDADGLPVARARTCRTSRPTRMAIAFGDFRARLPDRRPRRHLACCAIPTPPSPTCCSTRPSASAAACRTSRRSSC